MGKPNVRGKIVKPLAEGQVTTPAAFGEAWQADPEALPDIISLVGEGLRRYTQDEVPRFVEEERSWTAMSVGGSGGAPPQTLRGASG